MPPLSADLPAMMALEKHAATAAHWSVEQYEALFRASNCDRVALVIEEEYRFRDSSLPGGRAEWEIENIAIAAPARRRGLGTRLLGELLDMARARGAEAVFLEVRRIEPRGARACTKSGRSSKAGAAGSYYKDPEEDAILYRLDFA